MILPMRVATGVADGSVTLAFRRWSVARVAAGDVFHSTSGLVRVESVDVVDGPISDSDARSAGAASATEIHRSFRGTADDPIFRITLAWAGPDPRDALSSDASLTDQQFAEIGRSLRSLDRHDAWTAQVLSWIAANPGRRAGDLADVCGQDSDRLKIRIRRLKNLGLTLSQTTGYEISPRGRAYLDMIDADGMTAEGITDEKDCSDEHRQREERGRAAGGVA